MATFVSALTPVLVLILLGYFLRRFSVITGEAWTGLEKLTYYLLLPALLVRTLGSQNLGNVPWHQMFFVIAVCVGIAAFVLLIWYRIHPTMSAPIFTSVFQGGVRFNTYIALAVSQAFFGIQGIELAAVAVGVLIVLVNLLSVCVFVVSGQGNPNRSFVLEIAGNPLVLACGLGWLISLSHVELPQMSLDVLEIIGRAALPLGLLAVGAALRIQSVPGHLEAIATSSVVQFGLKPVLAWWLINATGLSGAAAGVILVALMTPTAPSAYILSRQLGGDTETMASIITFQTLLAFVLMPLIAGLVLA